MSVHVASAGSSKVDECHKVSSAGYRRAVGEAFSSYQRAAIAEWQRQVEFRLRAAPSQTSKASRARSLATSATTIQNAFKRTQTGLIDGIAADTAGIASTLNKGVAPEDRSVQVWIRKPAAIASVGQELTRAQNQLLRFASTGDKTIIRRIWKERQTALLNTFTNDRLNARQNFVRSMEECLQVAAENADLDGNDPTDTQVPLKIPGLTASSSVITQAFDPNDNSNEAHPELDWTKPEYQNQADAIRIADDPRTRSAYYGDNTIIPGTNVGTVPRGCLGVFAQTATPRRGTLIKGSDSLVYYYASNGNRYVFPSAMELQSWFGGRGREGLPYSVLTDTTACRAVKQVPDALLASMRLGGNVPVRPGLLVRTIGTGLSLDQVGEPGADYSTQAVYMVDLHHTLRRLSPPGAGGSSMGDMDAAGIALFHPYFRSTGWSEFTYKVTDSLLRQDYVLGAALTDVLSWHQPTVTIEGELGI